MNLNRFLAGILACCVVGISSPYYGRLSDDSVITASAADEYTEGTYGLLKYKNYGDYIEISGCDDSATEVVIPAEIDGVPVTSIGNNAFAFLQNLISVTVPEGVTSIGYMAFMCTPLKAITLPDTIQEVGMRAFWGSKLIEDNTNDFFTLNHVLIKYDGDKITIDDNGEMIYDPKPAIIPDDIKVIAAGAFQYSYASAIEIPDSVVSIGDYAFSDCDLITEMTIPDSVTNIGGGIFNGCSKLEKVTLPNTIECLDLAYFDGLYRGFFTDCTSLKYVEIPNGVKKICGSAFTYCESLEEIVFPESVEDLYWDNGGKSWAPLGYCTNLKSVTILNPECNFEPSEYIITNFLGENSSFIFNGYGDDNKKIYTGIIRGYENSTAQAYAEKFGYTFVALNKEDITTTTAPTTASTTTTTATSTTTVKPTAGDYLAGDANVDKEVTVADAAAILQYLGNNEAFPLTEQGKKNGDVDGTDGLTPADALAIQKFKAGLVSKLPL